MQYLLSITCWLSLIMKVWMVVFVPDRGTETLLDFVRRVRRNSSHRVCEPSQSLKLSWTDDTFCLSASAPADGKQHQTIRHFSSPVVFLNLQPHATFHHSFLLWLRVVETSAAPWWLRAAVHLITVQKVAEVHIRRPGTGGAGGGQRGQQRLFCKQVKSTQQIF